MNGRTGRNGRIVERPLTELGRRIRTRLRAMQPPRNQAWLASRAHVSPQYISDVLRSAYISAPFAVRLARILDVNVEYLAPDPEEEG